MTEKLKQILQRNIPQHIPDCNSIIIEYNGGGGDRYFDYVEFLDEECKRINENPKITELILAECRAILDISFPGWNEEDGSSGTFCIYTNTGLITLDHTERIMTYEGHYLDWNYKNGQLKENS